MLALLKNLMKVQFFSPTMFQFLVNIFITDSFPNAYLSFSKIQSGLSNEELDYIHNKIGRYWKTSDISEGCDLKFGKEKPHLWIPPGNSLLLVVIM